MSGFMWNTHKNFRDKHAFLSASNYHWINYDDDKMLDAYGRMRAKEIGTRKHALASDLIDLRIKLPDNDITFNRYVNDGIAFRMSTEQILYYSDYAFGTADAISFRKHKLRIHDLKTGTIPASMHQLECYAAFFCLEYGFAPGDIEIELRLYQNDEIIKNFPGPEIILPIMDKAQHFTEVLDKVGGNRYELK